MFEPTEKKSFALLQIFRVLLSVGAAVFFAFSVDTATPGWLLLAAAASGVIVSGLLIRRTKRPWRTLLIQGVLIFGVLLLLRLAESRGAGADAGLAVFALSQHFKLLAYIYAICFLATWLYWSFAWWASFEILVVGSAFIWTLSSHRNYHLDAPKQVSSLAWKFGFSPQQLLLGFGALLVASVTLYLFVSEARPLRTEKAVKRAAGASSRTAALLLTVFAVLLLVAYGGYINRQYSSNLSRATEGVGENNKEGQSPLGFHSAIGKTRQPAALLRLERDYQENPWSPMLYLREGALSSYNGRELVIAPAAFDSDVPRLSVGQPFSALEKPKSEGREEITQSVYLLAKHMAPFALDFPISIRTIPNPAPERFNFAYQAVSLAPVDKLDTLIGETVGDPAWSKETLEHYLRAPGSTSGTEQKLELPLNEASRDERGEDRRYLALMQSLTAGLETPVQKAMAIVSNLSETSTYTRSPGHQTSRDGDPVAPYLFSDTRRGYCVHFAHAAVYLMRLAGIPARIATGYLTDLSYAKDGHILLHLGDRHAWPEFYVKGRGWVVADVTPQKAENEQAIVPDEKLLEELMNKLDPLQATLPEMPGESVTDEPLFELPPFITAAGLKKAGIGLLLLFLLSKLWLRFGYLLPAGPERRIRRAYIAFASQMNDFGVSRENGETRAEFSRRLENELKVSSARLTNSVQSVFYREKLDADLKESVRQWKESTANSQSAFRRALSFFNIRSLLNYGRW